MLQTRELGRCALWTFWEADGKCELGLDEAKQLKPALGREAGAIAGRRPESASKHAEPLPPRDSNADFAKEKYAHILNLFSTN